MKDKLSATSRIPKFYKLSVKERVRAVHEHGMLTREDYESLANGNHTLKILSADKMIENVVGVMGLPVGLGLNFFINDKDYVVPLVVEEPSIVAALSASAKLARASGGFTAQCEESLLIGQIQMVNVPHPAKAQAAILQRKTEVLNLANNLHPRMVARGGGAVDLEVHIHRSTALGGDMVVVHLLVDTCDAMGANMVNTMCEGVASLIEKIADGEVFLRILSNLTDRSLVQAQMRIPYADLAGKGFSGEKVRDGIIVASEFAALDPYRAATHNKGIMNGVDALAIATGNDWRAIEAAAHAYAARGSHYTSLTRWYANDDGDLCGEIDIPLKVGTVGGPLQSNPTVAVNLRMLGVESAKELAEVMAAVGLAQNFAALRALATEGIQQGHMTLHARSVAQAAGAKAEIFDTVVERLIESGDIKIWKAEEIVEEVSQQQIDKKQVLDENRSAGYGKAILLGEHAAVYGRHVLAAPIPIAVEATCEPLKDYVELLIPRWGVEYRLSTDIEDQHFQLAKPLKVILNALELAGQGMRIEIFPNVPKAMGLGGSAAVAVAIVRAVERAFKIGISDERVNAIAYECEKIAHGTPSGIDNTMATYGELLLYKPGEPPQKTIIKPAEPLPLVIGITGIEGITAQTVAKIRDAWSKNKPLYERIFDEIDQLTLSATEAVRQGQWEDLGQLMNICQGQLNALQVSSWELEEVIQIARRAGALGAKLTGGGGGGSVVAICPDNQAKVAAAIQEAGYQALEVTID